MAAVTTETQAACLRVVYTQKYLCIITSIPSNKAPGIDKIPIRVIKDCLNPIVHTITSLVNMRFSIQMKKSRGHTNSPVWKRVTAWERSRAASGYGIIWGDADRNKQERI